MGTGNKNTDKTYVFDPTDQNVKDIFADIASLFKSNGDKEIVDKIIDKYQQKKEAENENN